MKSKFGQRFGESAKMGTIYTNVILSLDHNRIEFVSSPPSSLNHFLELSGYASKILDLVANLYRKGFMVLKLENHPP